MQFNNVPKKKLIFSITFTAFMLALIIIFQYFEKFTNFKFIGVTFNLTLIFYVLSYHMTGTLAIPFLLITRFLIGPALGQGYTAPSVWGHFISFTSWTVFLIVYIIIMNKFNKNNEINKKMYLIAGLSATLFAMVFMTLFNLFVSYPVYIYLFHMIDTPSPIKLASIWGTSPLHTIYTLGIKNYYAGVIAVTTWGNFAKDILNFIIIGVILIGAEPVIKQFSIRGQIISRSRTLKIKK